MTIDVYQYRWPMGAEKVELVHGCPVFYGEFDQRDVEIARRAFPRREVVLDEGLLVVCPEGQPDFHRTRLVRRQS